MNTSVIVGIIIAGVLFSGCGFFFGYWQGYIAAYQKMLEVLEKDFPTKFGK